MNDKCAYGTCQFPLYLKELCVMHYQRRKRGTDMDAPRERRGLCLTERLWQYIDVRGLEECWEWTGRRNRQGYGQFALYPPDVFEKKTVLAHRLAYETFWGIPLVNNGLHHVGPGCSCGGPCIFCNNPPCCNPLHLYDGTLSQNSLDSVAAGTAVMLRDGWRETAIGERNGLAKLTDDAVRDIRKRYAAGGISQQKLADEYEVAQSKISSAIRRETWKHVE